MASLDMHTTFQYTDMEELVTKKNVGWKDWQHFGLKPGGKWQTDEFKRTHLSPLQPTGKQLSGLLTCAHFV